jgi:3-hydroxyisobutyrate dehydrogenase-like beta-hydroxyacid dehydrogenase
MSELTIGFVGLGALGWPMAANPHTAGFALVVRGIDATTEARFAAEHPGAIAASTPPTSR